MSEIKVSEVDMDAYNKSVNEQIENANEVIGSFQSDIFSDGITSTIDAETMQEWLSNPDEYLSELEKLTSYYYISNPGVFQLFDLTVSLPSLNYKLKANVHDEKHKENVTLINSILGKVKHKQLTRDLISQLATSGTVCGLWVGTKKKPYLYVFDNLAYIFPARRKQGEWAVWVDLKWFDTMNEIQRESVFDSLSPHVNEGNYKEYQKDSEKVRYVELPIERSVCLRVHTLFRNQRFGIPLATQSFFDVLHKEKLKALEKSISNKVINSVAVLSLGNDKFDDTRIQKKKQKVYGGVKRGLEKNTSNKSGITVLGIPHWSKLEFPEIKTDGLDPDKFESIDKDINAASSGVMGVINGSSNFSAGNLSIDIFYRKIGVFLEQIEQEVYHKLINLTLLKRYEDEYWIEYEKTKPLSTKEKVGILKELNGSFGTSLKAVIDELEGVDYEQFIKDTMYEQDVLKLPEKLKPYASAYTQTAKGDSGRPTDDDANSDAGASTKTNDGNSNPSPSD